MSLTSHLENNVINVLAKEVEEEPVSHRRLLHHQLYALWLDPDQCGDGHTDHVDDGDDDDEKQRFHTLVWW